MKNRNLFKDEKGQSTIFMALLLVLLMGFSTFLVDTGYVYGERRNMVTAADAATLGGAQVMEDELRKIVPDLGAAKITAENVARDLAKKNGVVKDEDIKVIWNNDDYPQRDTITVVVTNNINTVFARFLNPANTDSDVSAKAVATWGYITKVKAGDILPVFTKEFEGSGDVYLNPDIVYLHSGKFVDDLDSVVNGNWGLLDIFKSSSGIADAFEGEYMEVELELDTVIDNKTGLDVGKVNNPIETRMKEANKLSNEDDRRAFMTGLVPVIDWDNITQQGSSLRLPIKYFAYFEIYDVITSEGNDKDEGEGGYKPSEGSKFALYDNSDYFDTTSDNAVKYHDKFEGEHLPKSTIIGKFTGTKVPLEVIVKDDDQTDPNSDSEIPTPPYSKLIE
ncbi:pilus assembly protein TadG-related protein [Gudongella sp. DL1XJH-153]|uniref:pilus assembly protein TadG-related protein n=1 Tax=Gudongella sp. DL1XJH-153 TaxID=3409804 RepID=UPI003BB59471